MYGHINKKKRVEQKRFETVVEQAVIYKFDKAFKILAAQKFTNFRPIAPLTALSIK